MTGSGIFYEEQIAAMRTAVDAVCRALGLTDVPERREAVARAAVWYATQNELDGARLTELLMAQFAGQFGSPITTE